MLSDELVFALAVTSLVLVLAAAACLVARRRVITSRGGVVECFLRSRSSGRWQHGLAEYRSGRLHWHRSLSLRLRPHTAMDRRHLVVTASRQAGPREADWLGPGTMVVTCQIRPPAARTGADAVADVIEMAMSQGALTGYLAWLEAAPAYLSEAT